MNKEGARFGVGGSEIIRENKDFKVFNRTRVGNIEINKKLAIDEKYFTAEFNGKFWVAKWNWKKKEPKLQNKV